MFRPTNTFFEKRGHVWYSEGVTPICGSEKNPSPHVGLPVGEYNPETRLHYVFDQGCAVSVQDGMLVPCNGGKQNIVTYSANDTAAGVILNSTGAKVKAGETYTFKANKPIGFLVWDVFQNPETMPNDYKIDTTQTAPTIRTEGAIVIPMVYKKQDSITGTSDDTANKARVKKHYQDLEIGDLVCADCIADATDKALMADLAPTARTGGFRKWIEGEDKAEQIVGRVLAIEDENQWSTQGLEYIKADGVDVQSESTHGFPRHIWNAFKETTTNATEKPKYDRKVLILNLQSR